MRKDQDQVVFNADKLGLVLVLFFCSLKTSVVYAQDLNVKPLGPLEAIMRSIDIEKKNTANQHRVAAASAQASTLKTVGQPRLTTNLGIAQRGADSNLSDRSDTASIGARVVVYDGGVGRREVRAQELQSIGLKSEYDSVYSSFGTTTATIATATAELYTQLGLFQERSNFYQSVIKTVEGLKERAHASQKPAYEAYMTAKGMHLQNLAMQGEIAQIKFVSAVESETVPQLMPLQVAIADLQVPNSADEAWQVASEKNPEILTVTHYMLAAEERISAYKAKRKNPVVELNANRNFNRLNDNRTGSTSIGITAQWSFGSTDDSQERVLVERKEGWAEDLAAQKKGIRLSLNVNYLEKRNIISELDKQTLAFEAAVANFKNDEMNPNVSAQDMLARLAVIEQTFELCKQSQIKLFTTHMKIQRTIGLYAR